MKTCHVCGCEVDDRELICPDCGATVVKHSGMLSLKAQEEVKKKSNPMGMTVSTGSGLTDILRADSDDEVEDEYFGGSLPTGLAKTVIDDSVKKKKSDNGKVFGTLFKILLVVILVYGVYWLFTEVIFNKDYIESYEKTLEIYVDAVNNEDVDKMETIIPNYLNNTEVSADEIMRDMVDINITRYDIIKTDELNGTDINSLQEEIKLSTSKTADIEEAVRVQVRFYGYKENESGTKIDKSDEVELIFIKYKNDWLIETENYVSPVLE